MSNKTLLSNLEIEALKFISKTNRKIHDGRVNRELKVVFTTLSFYAASVAFKLRLNFNGNKIVFN